MKKSLFVVCLLLSTLQYTRAQGCSDAGICSLPVTATSMPTKNQIEVAAVFGAGEADTRYISPYITYTRTFSERWSGAVKITASSASGSFGTRSAVGDAYLSSTYSPVTERVYKWSFTGGLKIPFHDANLSIDNRPLPMDYQSSLGTIDFLGGANLNYKMWDFNVAVQVPVINFNANSYVADFSGTDDFPTTNLFERKPDALLRATYTVKTSNKYFSFKPNLLFIYHLGTDTYEDSDGKRLSIAGSDGLTVNGNLISAYHYKTGVIELSLATPFAVRKVRPDGLTREWTVGIGIRKGF
ncbi:MAG: hypothetical protein CFE23_14945 [Flavobacterium sp. BFFFF1]|uniref:hypothetical protein n=1 Tax=Flavobacterium sp. BFFFF1 TaxID=2015557 RepID=UPI000BD4217E|nr:hypothetical protein [Flavobacterium sp. BFFFF1]OYU79222.1 MAG: hypothetical protein CFE23_14945 [Flavobacterium sp. BFFFF1]